jgi:hypothetical protein
MPSGRHVDGGGDESGGERDRGCDPDFPSGLVGQEFDVLDALPRLVERGNTAFEERTDADRCTRRSTISGGICLTGQAGVAVIRVELIGLGLPAMKSPRLRRRQERI